MIWSCLAAIALFAVLVAILRSARKQHRKRRRPMPHAQVDALRTSAKRVQHAIDSPPPKPVARPIVPKVLRVPEDVSLEGIERVRGGGSMNWPTHDGQSGLSMRVLPEQEQGDTREGVRTYALERPGNPILHLRVLRIFADTHPHFRFAYPEPRDLGERIRGERTFLLDSLKDAETGNPVDLPIDMALRAAAIMFFDSAQHSSRMPEERRGTLRFVDTGREIPATGERLIVEWPRDATAHTSA